MNGQSRRILRDPCPIRAGCSLFSGRERRGPALVRSPSAMEGMLMRWESGGERFDDCLVFFKVDEVIDGLPVGQLSNMSPSYPLTIGGVRVRSAEALYQALRFPHRPDWQREILAAPNAMKAKMAAKKEGRRRLHSRPDWDEIKVEVMRWVIRARLAQHYRDFFVRMLDWTGHRPICERSRRDEFWGAVLGEDGSCAAATSSAGSWSSSAMRRGPCGPRGVRPTCSVSSRPRSRGSCSWASRSVSSRGPASFQCAEAPVVSFPAGFAWPGHPRV